MLCIGRMLSYNCCGLPDFCYIIHMCQRLVTAYWYFDRISPNEGEIKREVLVEGWEVPIHYRLPKILMRLESGVLHITFTGIHEAMKIQTASLI